MALVMLPCELPWWGTLQRHLRGLLSVKHGVQLIDAMAKIHNLCNTSLDPDDQELDDPDLFISLLNFIDNDLTSEERSNFLNKTLPNIVDRALQLKTWKPATGMHFSLQQQPDTTQLDYKFISSLIAHCFFSTFPKRTDKTHPTLRDFNFTNFFKHLTCNVQKAKLKSILHYFDWLEAEDNSTGCLTVSRQVMTSQDWLTIQDWLECGLPLCPLHIKHEGKLERSEVESLHVCFSSSQIGKQVLNDGSSQESINFATIPELLAVLLNVESLEDNEVLMVENARRVSRIVDPKHRACLEKLETPEKITICCIDPEDYKKFPISQYEEDNILRELNKCLLGFRQKKTCEHEPIPKLIQQTRRLSPIGESLSSTPPEVDISVTRPLSGSNRARKNSPKQLKSRLSDTLKVESLANRRGRFIVLGSSGECLPISREPVERVKSLHLSCDSSEDEFHSAKSSLDEEDDPDYHKRYSMELDTPERRNTFAQRLRDALRRETSSVTTSTDDSNYAVGISVAGAGLSDRDIKLRRGGSRGFILKEESIDEELLKESLAQERKWIENFRNKHVGLTRKDTNESSKYSFSTEYSSELEEVYEQFSRWLEDPILETCDESKRELDTRDLAVIRFAGSLLKRTLSESFAGVPLTDGCVNTGSCNADESNMQTYINKKNKLVLNARSLSLELARHKHKLAAQLVSQLSKKVKNGIRTVSTGNWGCGESRAGDVQLKVIVQWLAASVAGVPALNYYTVGHQDLTMLDTICRILTDRKWTVKDLTYEMLRYSTQYLHGKSTGGTLFEDLIGVERT